MRNSEHLLAAPLLQLLPLPFGNLIGPRAAQWRHKQRAKASARARTEWTKFGHLLLSLGSQPTPPEAALLPFRVNFSTHVSTGTGGSGRRGKRLVSVIEIPLIGGGAHRKSRASVGGSIVECARGRATLGEHNHAPSGRSVTQLGRGPSWPPPPKSPVPLVGRDAREIIKRRRLGGGGELIARHHLECGARSQKPRAVKPPNRRRSRAQVGGCGARGEVGARTR